MRDGMGKILQAPAEYAYLQALAAWHGADTAADLATLSYWDLGSVT